MGIDTVNKISVGFTLSSTLYGDWLFTTMNTVLLNSADTGFKHVQNIISFPNELFNVSLQEVDGTQAYTREITFSCANISCEGVAFQYILQDCGVGSKSPIWLISDTQYPSAGNELFGGTNYYLKSFTLGPVCQVVFSTRDMTGQIPFTQRTSNLTDSVYCSAAAQVPSTDVGRYIPFALGEAKKVPAVLWNIMPDVLKFESQCSTATGSSYWTIWDGSYVIQSGDHLEYDIMVDEWAPEFKHGVEVLGAAGAWTGSGTYSLTDDNGLNNLTGDLTSYAKGKWYHRVVGLEAAYTGGKTLGLVALCNESDTVGNYIAYFANIKITDGAGTDRQLIYTTSAVGLDASVLYSHTNYQYERITEIQIYDYMVHDGYASRVHNVYRNKALVNPGEYDVWCGSGSGTLTTQACYPGRTFIRFYKEQLDYSGAPYQISADICVCQELLDGKDHQYAFEADPTSGTEYDLSGYFHNITSAMNSGVARVSGTSAVSVYLDAFNPTTADPPQSIARTGYGFQPKVILAMAAADTGSVDGIAVGTFGAGLSFGAATGSSARRAAGVAVHSILSANKWDADDAILVIPPNSELTTMYKTDVTSFDSGGVTLAVDGKWYLAMRHFVFALGGAAITNQYVGSFQTSASGGSNPQTITGVGFQPDLIILWAGGSTYAGLNTNTENAAFFFGAATSSSTASQAVSANYSAQGSPTNASRYCRAGESIAILSASEGIDCRGYVSEFNSDGFKVTWSTLPSTAKVVHFVCIKGGTYAIKTGTTKTDTTTSITLSTAFQPTCGIVVSASASEHSAGTPTSSLKSSIGFFTSTSDERCFATRVEDNTTNSPAAGQENDACYLNIANSGATVEGIMHVYSISSTAIAFRMADADPSEYFFWTILIGDSALNKLGTYAWEYSLGDYTKIPYYTPLSWHHPLSLAVWVKTGYSGGAQVLLSTYSTVGTEINIQAGGKVRLFCYSSATLRLSVDGSTVVNDGAWHHIVVAYDGSGRARGVKMWVDGAAETLTYSYDEVQNGKFTAGGTYLAGTSSAQTPVAQGVGQDTYYYYVGTRYQATSTNQLQGTLDEFWLFRRMIGSDDVSLLYNSGAGLIVGSAAYIRAPLSPIDALYMVLSKFYTVSAGTTEGEYDLTKTGVTSHPPDSPTGAWKFKHLKVGGYIDDLTDVSDIISQLCMIARARVIPASDDTVAVGIQEYDSDPNTTTHGYCDGYYDDIVSIGERSFLNHSNSYKNVRLRYLYNPWRGDFACERSVEVNPNGIGEQVYTNRFIYDQYTAQLVAEFIAYSNWYSAERMELVIREITNLSGPYFQTVPGTWVNIVAGAGTGYWDLEAGAIYRVRSVRQGIDRATLLLQPYNDGSYDHNAGSTLYIDCVDAKPDVWSGDVNGQAPGTFVGTFSSLANGSTTTVTCTHDLNRAVLWAATVAADSTPEKITTTMTVNKPYSFTISIWNQTGGSRDGTVTVTYW